ncbi:MAG: 6-phospho-beta-glucosidase [Acidobacteria bacterium]|nr:6-phospho-beta-glucosidase [Acidobacteriota bacterium]
MKKVAIIGGGGIRTPLVAHGLIQSREVIGVEEISLYDPDRDRVRLTGELSKEVARQLRGEVWVTTPERIEEAVEGADFVISSIRVGGMDIRARDERLAIDHGIAGQETTGIVGFAKAMRTIPVALEHARTVEKYAPASWFVSFTNPAGLITQALAAHTNLRLIGICDTPSEMFHRIALVLKAPACEVQCDYFGLNHLGWVRRILLRGEDVTSSIINNDAALRSLYHADLFDPAMIRALGMIPSEYLYFYYEQSRALSNQLKAGASRGEEIVRLNSTLFDRLLTEMHSGRMDQALEVYRDYLRRRSGSYMKLEAEAGSALADGLEQEADPFDAATGYHRIALDVMTALAADSPSRIVVNVSNRGAISDLKNDDVVEVPCLVDRNGALPLAVGALPGAVKGLVQSVKEYENLTIRAAIERSADLAKLALLAYPIVGQWSKADELVRVLVRSDVDHLGDLK